jgi:FkbM family methyltransferase
MYKYDFFGKEIKLTDNDIRGSFTNRHMHEDWVMKQGTIPILTILNKNINNQLFLDIGANTGSYCFLSLLFNNFESHAFEPVKHIYNKLKEHIELNKCSNKIKCYNLGISDKNEEKLINLSSNDQGGIHTYGTNKKFFRKHVKQFNKTELTEVKTLDSLYKNTNKIISYLKIDTEGSEYFILNGSKNLIKKFRPIIQMEWNNSNMLQCNIKYIDIINLIKSYNYTPLMILGEELFIIPNEKYNDFKHLKVPLYQGYVNNPFFNWINNF